MLVRMLLWLTVAFIVVSASAILWASLGPLKTAANVRTLQAYAAVQYLAAAILAGARLMGKA